MSTGHLKTGCQRVFANHHSGDSRKWDIVETAASNPAFSTLVAAVKAAGLVENIAKLRSIHLGYFAPTKRCFLLTNYRAGHCKRALN